MPAVSVLTATSPDREGHSRPQGGLEDGRCFSLRAMISFSFCSGGAAAQISSIIFKGHSDIPFICLLKCYASMWDSLPLYPRRAVDRVALNTFHRWIHRVDWLHWLDLPG